MNAILSYKNGEITTDKITSIFEELLGRYPDLLEEAYLFCDYKKINTSSYKKNIANSNKNNNNNYNGTQNTKTENKKTNNNTQNNYSSRYISRNRDIPSISSKMQTSPDFVFFSRLRDLFTPGIYKIVIKMLHLYNEGVLSHYEFIEMVQPYFSSQNDLFDYLKTLTYSKMMNRRQFAIFNRPNCELDLSKSLRVASYYELPKEYPYRISSGRNAFESSILNDRLITIPTGSEDDKNPMKKNHYEENLFKFEDQRYDVDMQLEIFRYAVDALEKLEQKVIAENITNLTEEELNKEIGKSNVKFICRYYKGVQDLTKIFLSNPKEVLQIVLKRFKERIQSKENEKEEVEKSIKGSFERFYYKSFDYRSFKFKNFDKKNNNAKAFLKDIINRKKDKLSTSNFNVLKGGTDNSEFYTSLGLKYNKELIIQKNENNTSLILLDDIDLDSMRKKLPELKIIFDNIDILKLTIALIYYQLYSMNNIDISKIIEFFNPLFANLFCLNLNSLIDNLKNNSIFINDKNLNYTEIIENIKNKINLTENDYEKFYQMDALSKTIQDIPININNNKETSNNNNNNNIHSKDNVNDIEMDDKCDMSMSLSSSSFKSQDTGKTFKDLIIFNNTQNQSNIDVSKCLFYPPKEEGDIMFYANEHCFVFLRYLFCIYERLNKLNEYANTTSNNVNNNNNDNNINDSSPFTQSFPSNPHVFKNYLIIYKALLHKKIENSTIYEELCRDILGNESYFLFNMDKLISSLIKTMITIINDNLSKEILNLFKYEITRKNSPNEKLYFANYLQLLDNNSTNNFRILFNPKLSIMCVHLMDLPIEPNKKDYYDQFKDFVNKTLQASYTKMYNDNQSVDDPFNIFLNRNQRIMKEVRNCLKPAYCSNNLVFRFDYANKKLQYLKSGCDVLLHNKGKVNDKERFKTVVMKNVAFNVWNAQQRGKCEERK